MHAKRPNGLLLLFMDTSKVVITRKTHTDMRFKNKNDMQSNLIKPMGRANKLLIINQFDAKFLIQI